MRSFIYNMRIIFCSIMCYTPPASNGGSFLSSDQIFCKLTVDKIKNLHYIIKCEQGTAKERNMKTTKNNVQKIIDDMIESGEWRRFNGYSRKEVKSWFKKNYGCDFTRTELEKLADEFAA